MTDTPKTVEITGGLPAGWTGGRIAALLEAATSQRFMVVVRPAVAMIEVENTDTPSRTEVIEALESIRIMDAYTRLLPLSHEERKGLVAAIALLRGPTFRWVRNEYGDPECALLANGIMAGHVHFWVKSKKWMAWCLADLDEHEVGFFDIKEDAQAALETHIRERLESTE